MPPKSKKRAIVDDDDEPKLEEDVEIAVEFAGVDDDMEMQIVEHHGPAYGVGAQYDAGVYDKYPINQFIHVVGAAENNLKNVDVVVPKYKLVVITGLSGSGKSSLVFETMCREAQREFFETMSSFARRRLPKMTRPNVQEINGLSPCIVVDQHRLGNKPRSTVGTATEIYTYLRLLYSRIGQPQIGFSNVFGFNDPSGMCMECHGLGEVTRIDPDLILDYDKSLNENAIEIPGYKPDGYYMRVIASTGMFDMDKKLRDYTKEELHELLYAEKHVIKKAKAGEQPFNLHFEGLITGMERRVANREEDTMDTATTNKYSRCNKCTACNGSRINEKARGVVVAGKTIPQVIDLEMTSLLEWLNTITGDVAKAMVGRMKELVSSLIELGVPYLSLNRGTGTLSGGECMRLKLSRHLCCPLNGMLYVLDEPTVGLHCRDVSNLINVIRRIRDKGNTVLVVEHDPTVMVAADWLIDVGPKAGKLGGEILYSGPPADLLKYDTLTSKFLKIHTTVTEPVKYKRRKPQDEPFRINGANANNLKNVSVDIPRGGMLVCVTGVAGSGKSTLIREVFVKQYPEAICVDQSPVGKSSRSNLATYLGIFDRIRKIFAKECDEEASLFSFNSTGACPNCKGLGFTAVELAFLDSVEQRCDVCRGTRFNKTVLKHKVKGRNISEVLSMTSAEAIDFFTGEKDIIKKLKALSDVGLNYLMIGQSLSTLSGGETQRLKLASELHKEGNIYVLDEPTTGLHMADIDTLISVLQSLVTKSNTVIVIEHNMDVVVKCDYVIDMGPGPGRWGGQVVACGTPEQVASNPKSVTAKYLELALTGQVETDI